jgi:predicted transcriptional regulator
MKRRTTSIKVDPELWKEFKKLAIDRGTTASDLIERFIRDELHRSGKR